MHVELCPGYNNGLGGGPARKSTKDSHAVAPPFPCLWKGHRESALSCMREELKKLWGSRRRELSREKTEPEYITQGIRHKEEAPWPNNTEVEP